VKLLGWGAPQPLAAEAIGADRRPRMLPKPLQGAATPLHHSRKQALVKQGFIPGHAFNSNWVIRSRRIGAEILEDMQRAGPLLSSTGFA